MKTLKYILFAFFMLFIFANIAFSYPPPDSCLKTFFIPTEENYSNPYDVKVDSCQGSSTFLEYYGKLYFAIKFTFNIIPRSGVFPEDTIIEYNIGDIESKYTQVISNFQELETEFGPFKFMELLPEIADTTQLSPRMLFVNFEKHANIDSAVIKLKTFNCVESVHFNGWFEVISEIETESVKNQLIFRSDLQTLTVKNTSNYIENQLQIYNLSGIEVKKVKITQNTQSIDLSSLERGFYIVRFGSTIEKIIIQ